MINNIVLPDLEWKIIPGFENYQVSNYGDIYSNVRKKGKHLKSMEDKDGYLYVIIKQKLKVYKHRYIHQLVLLTYIGPCPNGMECSHIDNNVKNNCISNLEYIPHLHNMRKRYENGTYSDYMGYRLNQEEIQEIINLYASGETIKKIANDFNKTIECIRGVLKRNM